MAAVLSSFAIGVLFGLGLSISEMINAARVIGFLDVAGRWDVTLLLVMGGALAVTLPLYPIILRRHQPVFDRGFALPIKKQIDGPLVLGAVLFGIGWGLAGLCPGPALANLASGSPSVTLFVAAMILGQYLTGRIYDR